MSISPKVANEIARLMRDPNSMRGEWERMQRSGWRGRYDPNQPRVPAGHSDGGRWTDTGRSAGPGAHDRPQIDRAVLAGPVLNELIAGHLPIEKIEARTGRGRIPIELVDALKLGLYNEAAERNGRNQQAIIEFRAAQYGRKTVDVTLVKTLSRVEVGQLCERFGEVQDLTDNAVAAVRSSGAVLSAQQFGTAVHAKLKADIDGRGDDYLKAEVSFLKGREDDYGVKGTIRIDALERVRKRPDTVCIYDIKTGRSGLSFPRMLEMVVNSQKAFNGQIRHFIVTEVRPTR